MSIFLIFLSYMFFHYVPEFTNPADFIQNETSFSLQLRDGERVNYGVIFVILLLLKAGLA
jgi:hypothetical protein